MEPSAPPAAPQAAAESLADRLIRNQLIKAFRRKQHQAIPDASGNTAMSCVLRSTQSSVDGS